jgi:hypothetical protein
MRSAPEGANGFKELEDGLGREAEVVKKEAPALPLLRRAVVENICHPELVEGPDA